MPVTANDMPNYRYGVRGMKLSCLGANNAYETPWIENGIETVDESGRATTNSTTFYSDDGKPATVPGATGNDTMTVTAAEFSDDYQTKIMGHVKDATTGAIVKRKTDEAKTFAAGWEVQGTLRKTRIWKTGITSSEPAAAAFQTKGENVSESPESATWTINGDEFICHEGETGFATFLDAVPTAPAAAATTGNGN